MVLLPWAVSNEKVKYELSNHTVDVNWWCQNFLLRLMTGAVGAGREICQAREIKKIPKKKWNLRATWWLANRRKECCESQIWKHMSSWMTSGGKTTSFIVWGEYLHKDQEQMWVVRQLPQPRWKMTMTITRMLAVRCREMDNFEIHGGDTKVWLTDARGVQTGEDKHRLLRLLEKSHSG